VDAVRSLAAARRSEALSACYVCRRVNARAFAVAVGFVALLGVLPDVHAGSEALSELMPPWTAGAETAIGVALIAGPWATALVTLLFRASATVRLWAALYGVGSALLIFTVGRDSFWSAIVASSAVLPVIGRRPFDRLFQKVLGACRAIWRAL